MRLVPLLLVLSASYFGAGILHARGARGLGLPAFDTYAYLYPNVLYALDALREGAGLLWNPYQNCGRPFFATSATGLLYPGKVVFALLDRETALLASLILDLSVAGIGTFFLARAFGLGRPAALAGAFAFQLGGSALSLAAWSPILPGYAWTPVAMLCVERLLARPSLRTGALLGVVLTIQLLPGLPQTSFFTYQLIVLRVGWAMLMRAPRRAAILAATGLGLALPLALGAVQLLPALEVARASVRNTALGDTELLQGVTWELLRERADRFPGTVFCVVLPMLALAALTVPARRALVVFHLLVAAGYVLLALGPGTPLFDLYAALPLGRAFRGPDRLLWVTSFALAVLAALGTQALQDTVRTGSRRRAAAQAAALVAGAALFHQLYPRSFTTADWIAAGLLVITGALATLGRRIAPVTGLVLPLAVFLNCIAVGTTPFQGRISGDIYRANADAFAFLQAHLTSQDRVYIHAPIRNFALLPKSASMFRVPTIFDYEAQASRAYAEFYVRLRSGRPMTDLRQWYYPESGRLGHGFERRLFDLTAARYLLVDRAIDDTGRLFGGDLVLRFETPRVRVYENPGAAPRAAWMPALEVVPPGRVLPMLAAGTRDPRRLALVSRAPRAGPGGGPAATGTAEIVRDDPEEIAVRVRAGAAGFLLLADQYFPGWRAEVNGRPAEILRANHVFRLVPVPAGEPLVVFRYRPRGLVLGAALSLATVLLLAVAWVRAPRATGR